MGHEQTIAFVCTIEQFERAAAAHRDHAAYASRVSSAHTPTRVRASASTARLAGARAAALEAYAAQLRTYVPFVETDLMTVAEAVREANASTSAEDRALVAAAWKAAENR